MQKLNRNFLLFTFFGFILCFSACRKVDDPVVGEDRDEFDAEELSIIGNRLNEAIHNETGTFNVLDPSGSQAQQEVIKYLDRIYMSLVNTDVVEHRNEWVWGVKVLLDDNSENAFITPGGTFYITTGLLRFIQSEHELISVMGHEIMYADQGILLDRLLEDFGGYVLYDIVLGNESAQLTEIATSLKDISYTQTEVKAADMYSIDIVCEFLYNPHGMEDFLGRVVNDASQLDWTMNRPSADDRIPAIQASAGGCGPGNTFLDRYQEYIELLP